MIRNYKNEFISLYIELEKNYFFSSLLKRRNYYFTCEGQENYNGFNDIITKIYIEQCSIDNKDYGYENVDIYFDYNLPSKNLIEKMNDLVKNEVVENYLKNENIFRNINPEYEDEFEKEKKRYENNLAVINDYTLKKFKNFEFIKKIEEETKSIKLKFYNLLFEDYLSFVINKTFQDKIFDEKKDIKLFLKIIINNKFDIQNIDNIDNISKTINWLNSYLKTYFSFLIFFLCKFFLYYQMNVLKIYYFLFEKQNYIL